MPIPKPRAFFFTTTPLSPAPHTALPTPTAPPPGPAPDGAVDVLVIDVLAQVHGRARLRHTDHRLQVAHRDGHAVRHAALAPQLRVHLQGGRKWEGGGVCVWGGGKVEWWRVNGSRKGSEGGRRDFRVWVLGLGFSAHQGRAQQRLRRRCRC